MKKNKSLKAIVLSLGVAAMLLPAKTLNAQDRPGGLYGTNVPTEQSNAGLLRDGGSGGGGYFIHSQTFFDGGNYGFNLNNGTFEDVTPEVPLGSGLFIMAAAGAGYALKKRKDNKKQ